MLAETTSVTDNPTNGHAYWHDKLPMNNTSPPANANATDGPLSCNSTEHPVQFPYPGSKLCFLWCNRMIGWSTRGTYLVQLGDEIGPLVGVAADLAEGEGEQQRGQEVSDAVVQVGVHEMAPPPLHQVHDRRPCAQKAQRCQHQRYGRPLVLH